jgi:hypothetical protein
MRYCRQGMACRTLRSPLNKCLWDTRCTTASWGLVKSFRDDTMSSLWRLPKSRQRKNTQASRQSHEMRSPQYSCRLMAC